MNDYVYLETNRNRGWPWDNDGSGGLTSTVGEDGWCRTCGVAKREQCGDLVLMRKGLSKPSGAWVPNWLFDVFCVERSLADEVASRFDVTFRDVRWPKGGPGDVAQIVTPVVGDAWYEYEDLEAASVAQKGKTGEKCPECGVWRWQPMAAYDISGLRDDVRSRVEQVIASPEWFGSGHMAYRQVLFSRQLGEFLAAASPRDLVVVELP